MFATPLTVGLRTYTPGAVDDFGDPVDAWSAPVSTPVYGWSPAGTAEPFEANRNPVTWDLDLLVPPAFACGPMDRIDVPGEGTFGVEGRVQSYNTGPFGFQPGSVVRLRLVEG